MEEQKNPKSRTTQIMLAVNKIEKGIIEKAAENDQRSISQFIRLAVLEKINSFKSGNEIKEAK